MQTMPASSRKGIFGTFTGILRTEGPRGLYSGVSVSTKKKWT
jgi:hypothetical protein